MPNAQMTKKIVYWQHPGTKELRMGLPEHFNAPWGWDKIVCTSAMQAEWYSEQIRKQEKIKNAVEQEQRDRVEEPIRTQLRSHIHNLMAHSKDNLNREFLRRYLEKNADVGDKTKGVKTSFLHYEAYSENHKD